jgi:hypothetical protein
MSSITVDTSTGLATAHVTYTPTPNYNSQLTGPGRFLFTAIDQAGAQSNNPPAAPGVRINRHLSGKRLGNKV